MESSYSKNLLQRVINNSVSSNWNDAVLEWNIVDVEEDDSNSSSCICGKDNIKYLYTIKNENNGKELYPIGSCCIKKFNRSDLSSKTKALEKLYKLMHAVENHEFITLDSNYFSRQVISYLHSKKVFC